MSDHDTAQPQPQRTRATVRDRDVAAQIVVDLVERGIPRERVTTQPLDPDEGALSSRQTGEEDIALTESVGKNLGAGWLLGFLIGAVIGAIGVSIILEPPWASPLAAGITLAVAIGVGYIAATMGFLQAGIARVGESGGEPLTEGGTGHGTRDTAPGSRPDAPAGTATPTEGPGHHVEIVVEAADAEQARTARAVFTEHRAQTTG